MQNVVSDFKKYQANANKLTNMPSEEALKKILISISIEWIALSQWFVLNKLASGKIIESDSSIALPLTNEMFHELCFYMAMTGNITWKNIATRLQTRFKLEKEPTKSYIYTSSK